MKYQIVASQEEILEKIRPAFEHIGTIYNWDMKRNGVDGSYLNHAVDKAWMLFESALKS